MLLVRTANSMNSQKMLGSQLSKTQLFYGPKFYANSININLSTLTDQALDLRSIFHKRVDNVKTYLKQMVGGEQRGI